MTIEPHTLLLAIVPSVIAFLNRPTWTPLAKWILAFVVCLTASGIEIYISGGFTGGQITQTTIQTIIVIMGTYATIWKVPIPGFGTLSDFIEHNFNAGPPAKEQVQMPDPPKDFSDSSADKGKVG